MTVMIWTVRPTFRAVEDDIGNALTATITPSAATADAASSASIQPPWPEEIRRIRRDSPSMRLRSSRRQRGSGLITCWALYRI
jgi:hypothetical protein